MSALTTVPVIQPLLGDAERDAVDRVMESGILLRGPEINALEAEFGHAVARGWATVAVNSGTSALLLSLKAVGVGLGDEVIVPSFAPPATVSAIVVAGATPVFADIDPGTFCVSPASITRSITKRTRAIVVVHLFGLPASMDDISALAIAFGLHVVEDASHAPGALWAGREVGTWGSVGAYSLGPAMNLTAGSGGMAVCATPEITRRVRLLREHGDAGGRAAELAGHHVPMSEMNAAIGRAQLAVLARRTARRRMHAAYLSAALPEQVLPRLDEGADPVWQQFVIRVRHNRERVALVLREEWGIATAVKYATPAHRHPAYAAYAEGAQLPETDRAAREALCIPVHPGLTVEDLERVAEAVNAVLA